MWLLLAALTGVLYTCEGLLQRFFLRSQKDAWAFSFFYSLVGTVISFPFMLSDPKVPTTLAPWLLAMLIGIIIVGHNLLIFKASNHLEISLIGALTKLRLVWVFGLGMVFLGVSFSFASLFGTILTMLAGLVIIHKFKRPTSSYAIYLVLVATVLNASIIILSKYLLDSFNAVSLTFFATFLPATIFNFILMPNAASRITKIFKDDWRIVLLTCGLGSLANLALNQALSLNDANSVIVISEVFLILTLVGEHILLKEKDQPWVKFASILLAIGGAILIQLQF
jgi:drug/metabolite transporter (DMT)-like permease